VEPRLAMAQMQANFLRIPRFSKWVEGSAPERVRCTHRQATSCRGIHYIRDSCSHWMSCRR
jgi:hypothetical protein